MSIQGSWVACASALLLLWLFVCPVYAACPPADPCLKGELAAYAPEGPLYHCASRLSHVGRHRYGACSHAAPERRHFYLLSVGLVGPRPGAADQVRAFDDLRRLAGSYAPAARSLCFAALGAPWNVWGVRPHSSDCDSFAHLDHPLAKAARGHLALRMGRVRAAHRLFGQLRLAGDPAGGYGLGRLAERSGDQAMLALYRESAGGGDPLAVIRAGALLPVDDAIVLLTPWAERGLVPAQALLAARLTQRGFGPRLSLPSRWRDLWADAAPFPRPPAPGSESARSFAHAYAWTIVVLRSHRFRGVPGYAWAQDVARGLKHRFVELLPEHAHRHGKQLVRGRVVDAPEPSGEIFQWTWTEWESVCIDATEACQVAGLG